MLEVALLGTGGTMPLPDRALASLLVRHGGRLFLVDCGEGTQISLRLLGWGFHDLEAVFLTHFHADHVSGLPGLLLMVGNSERRQPVTIYGPPGTGEIVRGLRVIFPELPYELRTVDLRGGDRVHLDGLEVETLEVDHALVCLAYAFALPRQPAFLPERALDLGIPKPLWARLQNGQPVAWDGLTATPAQVQGPPRPGLRLVYVTDTRPTPELPSFVAGADLLVAEGMHADPAEHQRLEKSKHMSFAEAAMVAREGGASSLVLTHFSPALRDPAAEIHRAREVFPAAQVGTDRMIVALRFSGRESGRPR